MCKSSLKIFPVTVEIEIATVSGIVFFYYEPDPHSVASGTEYFKATSTLYRYEGEYGTELCSLAFRLHYTSTVMSWKRLEMNTELQPAPNEYVTIPA